IRVLLVEDDKYFNKLLSDRLALEKCEVVSCLDGAHAWETIKESKFDVLLCDMLLPKIMGAELITKIRNDGQQKSLRIIAMSGIYKDQLQIQEFTALHQLEGYWTKPFNIDELIQAILRPDERKVETASPLIAGDLKNTCLEELV